MPRTLQLLALTMALLGCGENSDQTRDNTTPPLISAAATGDLISLKRLLQQQSADVYDSCQWTPLMKAALNGHTSIVEHLLTSNASVDLSDTGGYTALLLAASNNHHSLVKLLHQHGAEINHKEQTKGWTALIWAAKRGHLATVRVLLELGADRTVRDHTGMTAQDWAQKNGHIDIARLLTDS